MRELHEKTSVVSLNKVSDQWVATTANSSIRANKVIQAVNGLIENFGFYERCLMHINLYASMTWALTPADPLGSTVKQINNGIERRLLVLNCCTYDQTLTLPNNRLLKIAINHDQSFQNRFSVLKDVTMEY